MDPNTQRAIAERAQTQLGLMTSDQLRTLGVSYSTIRSRVAQGVWHRMGRHTLLVACVTPDARTEVQAAVLDHGGVASHRTALWLRDVVSSPPPVIDVTVVKGRSSGLTSTAGKVRVHTTTSLPAEDVSQVGGIEAVSVARGLFGVAALPPREASVEALTSLVEDAVRRRLASDRWLWWFLERHRCRGRNGVSRFEQVLARRSELGPTESWLERMMLRLLHQAGLPLPIVQRQIRRRGSFVARVDLAYDPGMIVIELLGYQYHATREQQSADAARASELQLLGWDVHQVTYDQLVRTPELVLDRITRALVLAGLIPRAA